MPYKFSVTIKQEQGPDTSVERKSMEEVTFDSNSEISAMRTAAVNAINKLHIEDGRVYSIFLFNLTEKPAIT